MPNKKPDLAGFADDMLEISWQGLDADGVEIQEIAQKHGIIVSKVIKESCGDDCLCAEEGFPQRCFVKTYLKKEK